MIVTVETMKKCEDESKLTYRELMIQAGNRFAIEIMKLHSPSDKIVICCGKGNNGGDGFVAGKILIENNYNVKILALNDKQSTSESKYVRNAIKNDYFVNINNIDNFDHVDVLVDCIFGFGFKGDVPMEYRNIFEKINMSKAIKYSLDINSGAEADSGRFSRYAIHSHITFALGYKKVFHQLRKQHFLFEKCSVIPLDIPSPIRSDVFEVDDTDIIKHYINQKEDAYKGCEGKPLIIGGSFGMVGALALNIAGAKAAGSSYIHVACEENVYKIIAQREISPVFHPFTNESVVGAVSPLLNQVQAICFGSGCNYLESKKLILERLLQQANCPVILDAEAIRLLQNNSYILKLIKTQVILTPHLKEFADCIGLPLEIVKEDMLAYAVKFAKEYHVFLVLKGPNTLVVSPTGELYINQTGNAALAKAGSGDFLTGLITSFVSQKRDVFKAVALAVYIHGLAADKAITIDNTRLVQVEDLYESIKKLIFEMT